MRSPFVALIGALFWAVSAVWASPVAPFKPLLGAWTAEGQAFGAPSRSRMVWAETLGAAFVRLDYRIEMSRPGGKTQIFEGIGHYKAIGAGVYQASWADNGGDLHPIAGTIEGSAFTSVWGVEGQKRGRTLYRLTPSGQVEVTDWIQAKDGSWKQFNHAVFSRAAN